MTKEIAARLAKYPIHSQDGKGRDAVIVCKFFFGSFTWYVLEGRKDGDDYEFFGVVDNAGRRECGYFTLSQLEAVRFRGMGVERDVCFAPQTIADCEDLNN